MKTTTKLSLIFLVFISSLMLQGCIMVGKKVYDQVNGEPQQSETQNQSE